MALFCINFDSQDEEGDSFEASRWVEAPTLFEAVETLLELGVLESQISEVQRVGDSVLRAEPKVSS